MDISKISFFVNINLNKSYCKDCIIYIAHIVLDLSLPSFFFLLCRCTQIPTSRTSRDPRVTRAPRHTCASIRNPIRSTSSSVASISMRSSTRIRFAFRDHEGELFRITISRPHTQDVHVSHPTWTNIYLHFGRRAMYTISCCRNYLKTHQYLFSSRCRDLKFSNLHQGRWSELSRTRNVSTYTYINA